MVYVSALLACEHPQHHGVALTPFPDNCRRAPFSNQRRVVATAVLRVHAQGPQHPYCRPGFRPHSDRYGDRTRLAGGSLLMMLLIHERVAVSRVIAFCIFSPCTPCGTHLTEIWPVLIAGGSLYVVPEVCLLALLRVNLSCMPALSVECSQQISFPTRLMLGLALPHDQELRLSGRGLAAWMTTNGITTALLPTPLAELFLQDVAALPSDVCASVACFAATRACSHCRALETEPAWVLLVSFLCSRHCV